MTLLFFSSISLRFINTNNKLYISSCNSDEKSPLQTIAYITFQLSVNEAISKQLLEAMIIG